MCGAFWRSQKKHRNKTITIKWTMWFLYFWVVVRLPNVVVVISINVLVVLVIRHAQQKSIFVIVKNATTLPLASKKRTLTTQIPELINVKVRKDSVLLLCRGIVGSFEICSRCCCWCSQWFILIYLNYRGFTGWYAKL